MNERMKRPVRTMALTTLLVALYFPVQIGVIYGQSVQEKPVTNPAAAIQRRLTRVLRCFEPTVLRVMD